MTALSAIEAARRPEAPAGVRGSVAAWVVLAAVLGGAALVAQPLAPAIDVRVALRGASLALVLASAVVDLRTRRIPNVYVASALVLALLGAHGLGSALLGCTVAALPLLALSLVSPSGMGMGDVKLAGVGGALVGLGAVSQLWVGIALCGGALGLVALIRSGRGATLAYGPAIALGVVGALVF